MATNPNETTWLSITQSAELVGAHPNTIRNRIKQGLLPAMRSGRNLIRVNKADLLAMFTPYQGGEFGQWS